MASTSLAHHFLTAADSPKAKISAIEEDDDSQLAKQYRTPSPEPVTSFTALKERIRHHYELASEYYYSLWGEHIHHGYWSPPTSPLPKEAAQEALIDLLFERSGLTPQLQQTSLRILDTGCGLGGTARYLALHHGAEVLGITISGRQVEMAGRLSGDAAAAAKSEAGSRVEGDRDGATDAFDSKKAERHDGAIMLGKGSVKFLELDAESMGEYFSSSASKESNGGDDEGKGEEKGEGEGEDEQEKPFDVVWISEALSHFPDKPLFFKNAHAVLGRGGKLVIADWFRAEKLGREEVEGDIKPIEDGMLLPPLSTTSEYVHMAQEAGFEIFSEPLDISENVAKTWDLSWTLIQSPTLWAFAFSQGRDGIAFLQAFRAMRRGYRNGSFRYAVMVFERGC